MIGLRDSEDPDYPVNTLTGTTQSTYYDDYHPLLTYENLYEIAPNYDGMNYDVWTATGYATGSYVKYDIRAYKAQRTMLTSDTPSLTGTGWQTPVKDWVLEKENAAINKLLNNVFTDKKVNESTKTFLDSVQVVDGAARMDDTVTASDRFVGFEIRLKKANNIKGLINYIGLQFSTGQTVPVYLFHSSQKEAVGQWNLTISAGESFDWFSAATPTAGTNALHYVNYAANIDSGGTYYLGYFESDISGSAIEKELGCGDCGYPDGNIKWSKWAEIRPIEVENSYLDAKNLFDIEEVGYSDSNYGLNFSFSIESDITEMLVNKKALFTNALGYQFANDMLQEYLYNASSRMNKKQDTSSRNTAQYEFNATDEQDTLKRKLRESIKALSFDLSRISQVLPDGGGRSKIKTGAM